MVEVTTVLQDSASKRNTACIWARDSRRSPPDANHLAIGQSNGRQLVEIPAQDQLNTSEWKIGALLQLPGSGPCHHLSFRGR
eukprot:scaffold8700_cov31-Tisochrysis_lutea.AAC.4